MPSSSSWYSKSSSSSLLEPETAVLPGSLGARPLLAIDDVVARDTASAASKMECVPAGSKTVLDPACCWRCLLPPRRPEPPEPPASFHESKPSRLGSPKSDSLICCSTSPASSCKEAGRHALCCSTTLGADSGTHSSSEPRSSPAPNRSNTAMAATDQSNLRSECRSAFESWDGEGRVRQEPKLRKHFAPTTATGTGTPRFVFDELRGVVF